MWPGTFPNPGFFSGRKKKKSSFHHWLLLSVVWEHEHWAHMTPLGGRTSNRPHISTNCQNPEVLLKRHLFSFLKPESLKNHFLASLLYWHTQPSLKCSLLPTFPHRVPQTPSSRSSYLLGLNSDWARKRNNSSPCGQRRSALMKRTWSQASAYSHSHSSEMSTCQGPQNRLVVVPYFKN